MSDKNTIENEDIIYHKKNGFLYSDFKRPIKIDLPTVKNMIELRHEISNGEKQYWICNFKGLKGYNKDARDYADVHGQDYLFATAVIVNSSVVKYIANLWGKLKKPNVPFKIFNKQEDAENWIKKTFND